MMNFFQLFRFIIERYFSSRKGSCEFRSTWKTLRKLSTTIYDYISVIYDNPKVSIFDLLIYGLNFTSIIIVGVIFDVAYYRKISLE